MEKNVSVALILAQRIIDLFNEMGATETERYQAVQVATVLIPESVKETKALSPSCSD